MLFRLILLTILVFVIVSYFRRFFSSGNEQDQSYTDRGKNRSKEGDVTVENPESKKGNIKNDVGDYIDYEEID